MSLEHIIETVVGGGLGVVIPVATIYISEDIRRRGPLNTIYRALDWKIREWTMSVNYSDLYYDVKYDNRDDFERKIKRFIATRGETAVTEPKTVVGHLSGWTRRVTTILGTAGATAGLVVGDILAWQNLGWVESIGVTVGAVGVAAGTVWYIVDEYNAR